nr:autophagy-related protein 2 [Quercus suber]
MRPSTESRMRTVRGRVAKLTATPEVPTVYPEAMASWHKALLKYALSYTGLLDDKAIDVNNLDLSFGRQSILELKDVGLNIARITKLAQLPPSLRVETARILSLRLKVPGDFIFRSSIEVEVAGIEVHAVFDDSQEEGNTKSKGRPGSPATQRTPQHRKVHKRLYSSPTYDPGGAYIPSAPEIATSFLQEQSIHRRREIETSLTADDKNTQDSILSESSDGAIGIGTSAGITGYLASYLEGIMDRMKVSISNVNLNLEMKLPTEGQPPVHLIFNLGIGTIELATLGTDAMHGDHAGDRHIDVREISFHLSSDLDVLSDRVSSAALSSPVSSKVAQQHESIAEHTIHSTDPEDDTNPVQHLLNESIAGSQQESQFISSAMRPSTTSNDEEPDSGGPAQDYTGSMEGTEQDYDIKPGDDNISWGSRRSKTSELEEELWKSIHSDDDLPRSLILDIHDSAVRKGQSGMGIDLRQRRPVSPYDRNVQNSASWPIIDDAAEHRQVRRSPGSWPTLEHSQSSISQQLEAGCTSQNHSVVDNKAVALDATNVETGYPIQGSPSGYQETFTDAVDHHTEDLTQSHIFQHDEAQSIYMSAIAASTAPAMVHPGAWESNSVRSQVVVPSEMQHVLGEDRSEASQPKEYIEEILTSGNSTPRPASPTIATSQRLRQTSAERLMYLDYVSVCLPKASRSMHAQLNEDDNAKERTSSGRSPSKMPGTFSPYADVAASQRQGFTIVDDVPQTLVQSSYSVKDSQMSSKVLAVEIGTLQFDVDIPCCKLLYKASTFVAAFNGPKAAKTEHEVETLADNAAPVCSVTVKDVQLLFYERFRADRHSDRQNVILLLACQRIMYNLSTGKQTAQIGVLDIILNGYSLLHFDHRSSLGSSAVLTEASPDIKLTIAESFRVDARSVTRISMETLPLVLDFDMQVIDESFRRLGGLSSMLELGNSIISDDPRPLSPTLGRSPKGVHFKDSPQMSAGSEIKLDCRIEASDMILRGESCSVRLRTSSIKALYRESGIVASVGHITVTGPHMSQNQSDPVPIAIDISNIRMEHLPMPQNKDLEMLLTLLTPSKDKYDSDDDILIDTLLRQRRKGAVARINIGDIKTKLLHFDCLATLTTLGSEMGELSNVTKYLPEDERPGSLVLLQVDLTEVQLPLNSNIGPLRIRLEDFHLAHVGLPALLATSIGTITAAPVGGDDLVHPLIRNVNNERLPMMMARMLGNEVDSKVKLKLFNTCFEYSVPIILGLSAVDEDEDPEILYRELATSVANIAEITREGMEKGGQDSPTNPSSRKTELILLVHDSAIGLTPTKLPSKALFVLTDAQVSTLMPPRATAEVRLELNKAAIFLTDIVDQDRQENTRGSLNNTAVSQSLATALSKQGYSSVGSIGRARISAKLFEGFEEGSKPIEVDFSNDFLLLETCADSTQTLIATLSGLAPPTPPNKQPKYKIEPGITIEEMMSSFTGEPVVKPQVAAETIFDADEDPMDDPDSLLLEPTFDFEPDTLLADSEMVSSVYGSVSRIVESGSDRDDLSIDHTEENLDDIAESLLEDDPFEMPEGPMNSRMGDAALLRDLKKQCKNPVTNELIDLGIYELDDLGLDALSSAGQPLGSRYRFNTPASRKRKLYQREKKRPFPFQLRLRDVNAIWNIYDGFDWQRTRDSITNTVEQVEARADERKARHRQSRDMREEDEPVIGDLLFNSFYIGIPSGHDGQELRRQINRGIDDLVSETELSAVSRPTTYSASGRAVRQRTRRRLKLERSRHHKIGFELKGVSVDVLVFPPDSKDIVSSVDVRIKDFEIFDQVPTSTWSKFLTHLESDPGQREMAKPMFHIELLNVRTLEEHSAAEILLHVAVTPLRLHVDHDALDFITRFFEFKDETLADPGSASEQPFLQRVEIETVDLRLDYKPKRVDYAGLRSGHTSEFMNFITLDAANIQLRHAIVYGLRGFEPLHKTLNDIWAPDVTKNQLPTVLAGLAPVRSLVNIGVSAKEVVSIPIREYRKDGRIVRSIQKGAFHFGRTTTSELARFGAKVAIGTQNALQNVDLRLDYKPKRVDYAGLRSGHTSEFMNFITLDAANIQLRHAIVYGLRGFEPLHKTLNDIWAPDVTKNQLPTVLAGLAPVRSLVNIGVSAKEVVSIPIREYRKDGRIVRSIQKGAFHFGRTTTSELARFGAKVAIGTQNALQNVEEYLSPTVASSSTRPGLGRNASSEPGWQNVDDDQDVHEKRAMSSYANQPLGALPGLAAARRYLEHDLLTAKDAFIAVQGEILESSSPSGAAAVVARHAPVVMLRPLIGATKAIGTTLLGVGNQIDRDNVKRMADKYKSR